jgi:hypothetical protein
MNQPELVDLAKQGDGEAIAALLQNVMGDRDLVVKAHQRDDTLHILLEAELVPEQANAVRHIRQTLTDLGLALTKTVKIYGRQQGEQKPAWATTIEIVQSPTHTHHDNRRSLRSPIPSKPSTRPPVSAGVPIFQVGQFTYTTADLQKLGARLDPLKAGFIGVLALYGLFGSGSYTVEKFLAGDEVVMMFLHGVNLIFHEAGHTILAGFGQFIHILGGSLMQVMVPLVIAIAFAVQRQFYAGAVTLCWVGQNLWDVSIYIKDAQERSLPLLGGENVLHDWHFLLLDLNLLTKDQLVGNLVFLLGSLVYLGAIGIGLYFSQETSRA